MGGKMTYTAYNMQDGEILASFEGKTNKECELWFSHEFGGDFDICATYCDCLGLTHVEIVD